MRTQLYSLLSSCAHLSGVAHLHNGGLLWHCGKQALQGACGTLRQLVLQQVRHTEQQQQKCTLHK